MGDGNSTNPRDAILQACCALFAPSQVVELRILGIDRGRGKHKSNAAGWFNDFEKLAEAAAGYDQRNPGAPEGIYITLNPVHEGCLARSANRITEWQKVTTSDRDILHRCWLPIDVDPIRPAGVAATDAELAAARIAARVVASHLETDCGFPRGIRALSGNGVHLLYRIDLPNDKEGAALIGRALSALEQKFGTPQAKIDTTLHNAARILKLYGTIARKGEPLADRPHRRSQLLAHAVAGRFPTFADIETVELDKLQKLAGAAAAPRGRTAARKSSAKPATEITGEYAVDLDTFIAAHQLQVIREESFDSTGKRYILAACIFDSSHTGTSAALGRSKDGAVYYKCHHDSCAGLGWQEVKAKLGPAPLTAAAEAQKASKRGRKKGSESEEDDPWEIAKAMLEEKFTDEATGQTRLRRHRESFYRYSRKNRCYQELDDDTARVQVTRFLAGRVERVNNRLVSDVVNALGAIVTAPNHLELPFVSRINPETNLAEGDPQRRHWITLRNGILDLDRILSNHPVHECLSRHTPEWFSAVALPFDFPTQPEQLECPTWARFLQEIFEEDVSRIDLLQEAFGFCFLPGTATGKIEGFFVLHGAGRNGKSTVLNVLRALLSETNVSSLSVEQIAHQTMRIKLYRKLANLCSDMNEMSRVEEGLLKAIVSGDSITADRKYKDPVEFAPTCKLFFATNILPRFVDTTLGIWRRMILVPFDYVVPVESMDIYLFDRLEKELPAIFWWALQGMIRLYRAGRFTNSDRCSDAARTFRLSCLPILTFLDECTLRGGSVVANDLWTTYRRWCNATGLKKPKPLHVFIRDVFSLMQGLQYNAVSPGMEGHREIFGVSLRQGLLFNEVRMSAQEGISYWDT